MWDYCVSQQRTNYRSCSCHKSAKVWKQYCTHVQYMSRWINKCHNQTSCSSWKSVKAGQTLLSVSIKPHWKPINWSIYVHLNLHMKLNLTHYLCNMILCPKMYVVLPLPISDITENSIFSVIKVLTIKWTSSNATGNTAHSFNLTLLADFYFVI